MGKSKIKYIIGIDEAGRGPLAGPVAVGAVCIPIKEYGEYFHGMRDSKKLSEKQRDAWFAVLKDLEKKGKVRYAVALGSAMSIDTKGIVPTIRKGIVECLKKLAIDPLECSVLLDGGLKAPKEFLEQKTIIRGDASERVISIAAIAAKVTRDAYMKRLAKKYPQYGFEIHKGYGTKKHRENIKKFGPAIVHRKTFLRSLI